MALVEFC